MLRSLRGFFVLAATDRVPASLNSREATAAFHLHRYHRTGDDPFSGASLYACRCGVVRPAM